LRRAPPESAVVLARAIESRGKLTGVMGYGPPSWSRIAKYRKNTTAMDVLAAAVTALRAPPAAEIVSAEAQAPRHHRRVSRCYRIKTGHMPMEAGTRVGFPSAAR
jgi:hypothetical protein